MKKKNYLFGGLLLLALLLTRLLDFSVFWNLSKSETNYWWNSLVIIGKNISLEHFGISSQTEAQNRLIKIAKQKKEKIVSVSYYNLLYPNAYLIYNKPGNIKKEYFQLPWITVPLDEGINEVYICKFDLIFIKSKRGIKFRYVQMGNSFLPMGILNAYHQTRINRRTPLLFSSISPEFVNRIYLYYFFIPLFLIILLTFRYSKAIWITFYYFFMMLFLFHTAAFWFPHLYFIKIIYKVEIPKILSILFLLLNVITYFLFYKGIKIGKKYIKENGISLEEKFIVGYFLLLPIVLRF